METLACNRSICPLEVRQPFRCASQIPKKWKTYIVRWPMTPRFASCFVRFYLLHKEKPRIGMFRLSSVSSADVIFVP